MPGGAIFAAGVTQADDQTQWRHGCTCVSRRLQQKSPPGTARRALLLADDWLLLVVLFPERFLRALFRSFLGALLALLGALLALLGALFGRFLACLAGFHRRAFD